MRRNNLTGVTRGLPMKEIILQSKVRTLIPKPVLTPNNVLTTTLLGTIQQIQLNMLRPVNRYPGTQYQAKLAKNAYRKKRSRLI